MEDAAREAKTVAAIPVDAVHKPSIDAAKALTASMLVEDKLPSSAEGSKNDAMVLATLNSFVELTNELVVTVKDMATDANAGKAQTVPATLDNRMKNLIRQTQRIALEEEQMQKRKKGIIVETSDLITEIYTINETFTVQSVKEGDLKSIKVFDGSMKDDAIFADFLESIFLMSKTAKLTHEACKNVIYRKLAGIAKSTIKSMLYLRQYQIETITLQEFVSLLEGIYLTKSTKQAALLALEKVPKLRDQSGYHECLAHIVRHARLSVRDETDLERRELLCQSRALQSFLNCLVPLDRQKLIAENSKREELGQIELSLAESVIFLAKQANDYLKERTKVLPYETLASSVKVLQNEDADEGQFDNSDDQQALFIQGARGRQFGAGQNARFQRPRGQGNFNGRQTRPQEFQGQPWQAPRRGAGFPRYRGQGRGGQSSRGYRGQGQPWPAQRQEGRGQPWGGQRQEQQGQKKLTRAEQVGVKENCCFACGKSTHMLEASSCPYRGLKLFNQPCGQCGVGGHPRRNCLYLQPGIARKGEGAKQGQTFQSRGRGQQGQQRGRGQQGQQRGRGQARGQYNTTSFRARGRQQQRTRLLQEGDEEGETTDWNDWCLPCEDQYEEGCEEETENF